jgi:hypothetical protein
MVFEGGGGMIFLIPNDSEKNILILGEEKKSDSEFLPYNRQKFFFNSRVV